jgi:transposase
MIPLDCDGHRRERLMMGRREGGQGQFFYSFDLDKVVPPDHLVRQIDGVLDLGWVHKELAPYYSHTGRPSIDPVLMIRMLIVGYVFAIRSERRLCAEVQVNLASTLSFDLKSKCRSHRDGLRRNRRRRLRNKRERNTQYLTGTCADGIKTIAT